MKTGFNLSDWALNHRSFVWFLMIASLFAGFIAYTNMGREEDPSFAIKTMVIGASLPGATAEETVTQVTDRIEKKLQELDTLDKTRAETYAGLTVVYVDLVNEVRGDELTATWLKIRNMMGDITSEMPSEFGGFSFNDDFGDVYGSIYAFTADGFNSRELEIYVEEVRSAVLQLEETGKVELVGVRDPVVNVEFSTRRLASLEIDSDLVLNTLQAQNAIVPSGTINRGDESVLVRVSGSYSSVEDLAETQMRSGDTFFKLSDVADVTVGFEDPPSELFRFNGKEAIGLTIGMKDGGNIIDFGEHLQALMARVASELPVGIEIHLVADQPYVVEHSVNHFVRALVEAVVIVLAVSFVSLGMRAGLVVSMTIPLVLAMTFVFLDIMGITLQRISLGALIIALGLLVDDAMIAIETMISRLEVGDSLSKAASYAWTSIAFPMLSGTLVTVAGFIPIGLNSSSAGEYTISLFYVIAISLVLSWVVAVLFAPVLGATFLPKKWKHHEQKAGFVRRTFHAVLLWAIRLRWLTIGLTVLAFSASIWGMRFVENQFFPTSDRPELLVDVTLSANSAFDRTDEAIHEFEDWLGHQDEVSFWSAYVGRGAPRFVLTLDTPTATPFSGQLVIMAKDIAARDRLREKVIAFDAQAAGVEFFPKYLELGPPVGKPVQYRVTGPDVDQLRGYAQDLAAVLSADDRLDYFSLDWNEPERVVRVVLDESKLRQLGVTKSDVAQALAAIYSGTTITQLREGLKLVDVLGRGVAAERSSIQALENLQLSTTDGHPIPLTAFAHLEWDTEQPVILRENRIPTITVKAAIVGDAQPATIVAGISPAVEALRETLPFAYKIEVAGTVESSADSQAPIAAVVPLMIFVMLLLVMMQMQSFRLTFVVFAVAPLGLIGVVIALVASAKPLGFVAILGVLALIGILIRNSVILFQEVSDLRAAGTTPWDAVFKATDSRARPILLTAAAASLALIPISRQIFWGPMAYAMMGGIIVGTVITLLFAPALYCAVFRVREPKQT